LIDRDVRLVTDKNGTWIAVWQAIGVAGPDADVFFSRSVDGGNSWSAAAPLNTNALVDSGSDSAPHVATNGRGLWIAVWSSQDSLGNTIGTDSDIVFARSTNGGTSWSAPAPLNSNATSDSGADVRPKIVLDASGAWVAAWDSTDTLTSTVGSDRDIFASRSVDGGVSWTTPVALNANAGTDSGHDDTVDIAASPTSCVAVWRSFDALGGTIGTDSDILYSRSIDAGSSWSTPVPLNASAGIDGTDTDESPTITSDGSGNWVVVWQGRFS
jgi:predicted neuraminidase